MNVGERLPSDLDPVGRRYLDLQFRARTSKCTKCSKNTCQLLCSIGKHIWLTKTFHSSRSSVIFHTSTWTWTRRLFWALPIANHNKFIKRAATAAGSPISNFKRRLQTHDQWLVKILLAREAWPKLRRDRLSKWQRGWQGPVKLEKQITKPPTP